MHLLITAVGSPLFRLIVHDIYEYISIVISRIWLRNHCQSVVLCEGADTFSCNPFPREWTSCNSNQLADEYRHPSRTTWRTVPRVHQINKLCWSVKNNYCKVTWRSFCSCRAQYGRAGSPGCEQGPAQKVLDFRDRSGRVMSRQIKFLRKSICSFSGALHRGWWVGSILTSVL